MRRLYLKLYVAFVGIVLLGALAVGVSWHAFGHEDSAGERATRGAVELVADRLRERSPSEQRAELAQLAERLGLELELFDGQGRPLASSHGTYWAEHDPPREGFQKSGPGPGRMVRLEDGQFLALFFPGRPLHRRFFLLLAVFGVALALGSLPLARQITRRVEHLQRQVEAFGSGDLSARARVKGKDEIARLARSFNHTAEKIQDLVLQERRMLASASHELRSPLARVRMAIELLETAPPERRQALVADASRDIEELDLLVEDLLASVRAQAGPTSRRPLDLFELVAQVAARFDVAVDGAHVEVEGDRRMLERLTRNLVENALRHGRGARVRAAVEPVDGRARIVVEDEGPGVPEAERERIFEPFYRPSGHDESAHGGVGLGLSLVRQIAGQHGGRAWVEPRPGGGSRFIVELGGEAPS